MQAKVIVPTWWTPEGRRAKIRLKTSSVTDLQLKPAKGYFSLDSLVQYQYELASEVSLSLNKNGSS